MLRAVRSVEQIRSAQLSVAGDVSFAANSTLAVDAAPGGASDLVKATGTTILNGGVANVTGLLAPNTTYTLVTSGGGVTALSRLCRRLSVRAS